MHNSCFANVANREESRQPWAIFQFWFFFFQQEDNKESKIIIVASQYNSLALWLIFTFSSHTEYVKRESIVLFGFLKKFISIK